MFPLGVTPMIGSVTKMDIIMLCSKLYVTCHCF